MSKYGIIELHDLYDFNAPNAHREVVMCKECKHWCKGDDVYGICNRCTNTRQMRYDDFCSYGEREGE